jgi:hypothetical protein
MGYILDESVQQLIPEKFQQSALFRKRLKFYNGVHQQAPGNVLRERCGSECGDLEVYKSGKQFPPCVLRTITSS